MVKLQVPDLRVVVGTEVHVELGVSSLIELGDYSFSGKLNGPVQLLKVTEDVAPNEVKLRWTVRAAGAGPVTVQPFTLESAHSSPKQTAQRVLRVGHRQVASYKKPSRLTSIPLRLTRESAELPRRGVTGIASLS